MDFFFFFLFFFCKNQKQCIQDQRVSHNERVGIKVLLSSLINVGTFSLLYIDHCGRREAKQNKKNGAIGQASFWKIIYLCG